MSADELYETLPELRDPGANVFDMRPAELSDVGTTRSSDMLLVRSVANHQREA